MSYDSPPSTSPMTFAFRTGPRTVSALVARSVWVFGWLALSLGPGPPSGIAQTVELDAADPRWVFEGDARAGTFEGEPVLRMGVGTAVRPDVELTDGTIEFDMMPLGGRAFLGVVFRVAGEGKHVEDVYFRLHKSTLPDAIQYSPDFAGRGQWQLYHGPTATARAEYRSREWHRVRIEVAGESAAVFVDDASEPRLVISRLRTGSASGHVAFWGNRPGAQENDPPAALLRDIVVRRGETTYRFPAPGPERAPASIVEEWGVSEPFVRRGDEVLEVPSAAAGAWQTVRSEASGLVAFDRHVVRPEDGVPAVAGGLSIRSDEPRHLRLDLGFSDDASVFVNGELVFSGKHSFSHNFPRRQGLITLDQASLWLPLRAGENRVIVVVSEVYGGWGVMGRIPERQGVEVSPLSGP